MKVPPSHSAGFNNPFEQHRINSPKQFQRNSKEHGAPLGFKNSAIRQKAANDQDNELIRKLGEIYRRSSNMMLPSTAKRKTVQHKFKEIRASVENYLNSEEDLNKLDDVYRIIIKALGNESMKAIRAEIEQDFAPENRFRVIDPVSSMPESMKIENQAEITTGNIILATDIKCSTIASECLGEKWRSFMAECLSLIEVNSGVRQFVTDGGDGLTIVLSQQQYEKALANLVKTQIYIEHRLKQILEENPALQAAIDKLNQNLPKEEQKTLSNRMMNIDIKTLNEAGGKLFGSKVRPRKNNHCKTCKNPCKFQLSGDFHIIDQIMKGKDSKKYAVVSHEPTKEELEDAIFYCESIKAKRIILPDTKIKPPEGATIVSFIIISPKLIMSNSSQQRIIAKNEFYQMLLRMIPCSKNLDITIQGVGKVALSQTDALGKNDGDAIKANCIWDLATAERFEKEMKELSERLQFAYGLCRVEHLKVDRLILNESGKLVAAYGSGDLNGLGGLTEASKYLKKHPYYPANFHAETNAFSIFRHKLELTWIKQFEGNSTS